METKNIKEWWRQVKLWEIVKWTTWKLDSNAMVESWIYPYFTCSQETFRINEYAFDQEAVLLWWNNAAWIFPLKYYKWKFNAYQRTYVMSAIDNEVLDNKYLYYALIPELISFKNMSTWATTKFLTKGILDNFEVTLPLIQIQKYIAWFLSNYDNLIENNNRRIQILEQTAQEIYKEWFVDYRFPWHETIKMIDSRTDFWEIPEGWMVKEINNIGEIKSWFAFKSKDFLENGTYGLATIKNVQDGKFIPIFTDRVDTLPEKLPEYCLLEKWNILLSLTGNVWRVCLVYGENSLLNQRVWKIVAKKSIYHSYLYTLFRNNSFKRKLELISNWVAQQNLSPIEASKIEILIWNDWILEHFSNLIDPILEEIILLNIRNQNLKISRDLLLPKLISWEIDVSELEII